MGVDIIAFNFNESTANEIKLENIFKINLFSIYGIMTYFYPFA